MSRTPRSHPARLTSLIIIAAAGCAAGCAAPSGGLRTVAPATDAQRAALLDRVKALAGEWEAVDHPGQTASVFAVSSNGSVVREIMFPGAGHEMTNVYHMDGPDLVMTHYCAVGNQPRLRAPATTDAKPTGEIHFDTDSVTNLHAPDGMYMGQMTLVFVDADHIRQVWHSYDGGKLVEEPTIFDLRRRK